jgi:hypothetical protein
MFSHITRSAPGLPDVRFKAGMLMRRHSEKTPTGFRNTTVPFDPRFCIDMRSLQTGWEQFVQGEGRVTTVVPYGNDTPPRPDEKASPMASVPVCSDKLHAELVIDNVQITNHFAKLYNAYLVAPEAANGQIPWVKFDRTGFVIVGWDDRLEQFGDALIDAPAPQTMTMAERIAVRQRSAA